VVVVDDDHHGRLRRYRPVTVVGRLVGVVTMVVGISTFALVTAKVAEFLVRRDA